MHSFMFRANAVLTFGITVLAGLCILASFSDVLHFSHPDIHLEVLNVDVLHKLNNGNDEAKLTLNISADLRPVFSWNTKQLFVFVVAEYASTKNKFNQVSLWDLIVERKEDARVVRRVRNKYLFVDQGSHLRGQEFNLTMYWNVMPLTGRMFTEKRIVTGFRLPQEYTRLFSNPQEPAEARVRLLSDAARSKAVSSPKPGSPPSQANKVWIEKPKFTDFKLGPCLGTGSFGRVHLAHYMPTNLLCATKSLSKASILRMKQVIHVKQEKGILKEVDFPFIVNLIGYCQDEKFVHLVMEYVCGGEFFTYLRTTGRFDEPTARFYAAQVLLSFEYLHGMDIIYRDLKPENLLLDEKGNLKIADFGFAKKIDRRTYTLCGTPDYLAPEIILNKGHGKPVDWWAFGVLIYEMLAGYPPFYDDDVTNCHEKILKGDVKYPKHFSENARDLIKRLLEADLTKRIGCLKGGLEELKSHAWFSTLDWTNVLLKKDVPPIRPKVSGPEDSTCFDDYSKLEPIKHEFVLTAEDQKAFCDL